MRDSGGLSTDEVTALVRDAASGCRASFGRLVLGYWATAVGLAQTRIRDAAQAEDVAQESFLIAYTRLGELRDPTRFVGWLTRIVYTQCCSYLRWRRVRTTLPLTEVLGGTTTDSPDGEAINRDQRAAMLVAVRELPVEYQQVVILRFVTGLSSVEIARQLGESPGTVRVRLHRSYEKLRVKLADLACEVMEP